MGFSGMSFGEVLIVLVIVMLLFGTKHLGSLGSDLGTAIRSFRKAMRDDDGQDASNLADTKPDPKRADDTR